MCAWVWRSRAPLLSPYSYLPSMLFPFQAWSRGRSTEWEWQLWRMKEKASLPLQTQQLVREDATQLSKHTSSINPQNVLSIQAQIKLLLAPITQITPREHRETSRDDELRFLRKPLCVPSVRPRPPKRLQRGPLHGDVARRRLAETPGQGRRLQAGVHVQRWPGGAGGDPSLWKHLRAAQPDSRYELHADAGGRAGTQEEQTRLPDGVHRWVAPELQNEFYRWMFSKCSSFQCFILLFKPVRLDLYGACWKLGESVAKSEP